MTDDDQTAYSQRISAYPEPLRRGTTVTLTYDFTGLVIPDTILVITLDPPDGSCSIPLTKEVPFASFTIPDSAVGIQIVDNSNKSLPYVTTVLPPK